MVRFIIIRHGCSVANKLKCYAGQSDISLDELGYTQAEITSKYILENYSVDSVYSSDLSRAYETVKPIADNLNLRVIKRKELREIDVGLWQGKLFEEVEKEFPQNYKLLKQNPGKMRFDDGESYADVIFRVKKAIEEIAEKNDGKTVVIGTHGGTIRAMQAAWCDSPLDKVGEFSSISNCAVTIAEYSSGSLNFIKTGFTEHLNNVKTDCLKN